MSLPAKPTIGARLRAISSTVRRYHEIAGVGEIMRRYFVINAFDGSLTTLGVLAGSYVAVVDRATTVISLILSTAVSIGVAGFYGSYQVERAERDRALREIEESTLSSMQDTTLYSASRYATVIVALVDGISPLIASLLIMIPFFFVPPASMHAAFYIAGAIAFVELFLLGVFLGRVSRERLWFAGVKLVLAGVVALAISLLLDRGSAP
jgi:predicted membrane protein (TIGR00267 family)